MEFQTPTLHNKNIIKHLKDYMTEWNMSALALAEDLGVYEIYRWLNGVWPKPKSCELLLDYFGIDFTEKFAYYTPDGRLMFEGPHELFLLYIDVGVHWCSTMMNSGKIIRKSLPIAEGECAEYVAYDVLPESYRTRYSKVYEVYSKDEMVAKGNAREVCEVMGISLSTLGNRLMMSKKGNLKPHEYQVYHVGYDFKKNLEVHNESK